MSCTPGPAQAKHTVPTGLFLGVLLAVAIGAILLVISLLVNLAAQMIVRRFSYERTVGG